MRSDYLEKVYAGFLGMNIGIRLGAPVEPTIWTYERIRDTYGEITDYVKPYKNFAADDDVNGPVYFLRALYDKAQDRELTAQDVADAWLNYAREGVGMFWWGGYGTSTEHTAYLNLKHGISAPQSGSIKQNGKVIAEQIGGQIFIDTWGLVLPDDEKRAADYGERAASVSHDGEGLCGARFFCACISHAFSSHDILDVIRAGLEQIPPESTYAKVARVVMEFHEKHLDDFRACREMLERDWGYDKYPGVCHIIPNAGVCVLAMLYGAGDFARTVEIATMCGWDTDCNAGNVGTVLGVMNGIVGLSARYRNPINDGIILSGISGYLNNLDVPTYAKEVALLGYQLAGEKAPKELEESVTFGEIHFDFSLPGSTHNLRLSDPFFCRAEHATQHVLSGNGALKIVFDRMNRGDQCRLYYKPFYRRDEFSDERYSPVFSPTVYSGQWMRMKLYLDQWNGWETIGIAPYVRTMSDKKLHISGYVKLTDKQWNTLEYEISDTEGDLIDEIGIVIEGYSTTKAKSLGAIYLDSMDIWGDFHYTIAMEKQRKEFGAVTPFSMNHGAWNLEEGKLSLMCCSESFAYTGNYYAKDYEISLPVTPQNGESHLVQIRAQGAMRGYAAGFSEHGKAAFYKNETGWKKLEECEANWELGKTYQFQMRAEGDQICFSVDGKMLFCVKDSAYRYGMFGCGSLSMGRTLFGDIRVHALSQIDNPSAV